MTKASDNDFPSVLLTEQGSAPTSPAASHQRLYIRTSDHTLVTVNSSGTVTPVASSGTAGTSILLTYDLGADITNQAITGGTYFDLFANQNFTVASASSIVEVVLRGMGFFNDNASSAEYMCRVNIDSGGTPVLKYMSGGSDYASGTNVRGNPLVGGTVFISGLSAATHTIKAQITASGNQHFYCRASTNGPPSNGEFLQVQVIEHKN